MPVMKLKHLQELIKFFLVTQRRDGFIVRGVGGGAVPGPLRHTGRVDGHCKATGQENPECVSGAFLFLILSFSSTGEDLRQGYRYKRTPKSKQDLF